MLPIIISKLTFTHYVSHRAVTMLIYSPEAVYLPKLHNQQSRLYRSVTVFAYIVSLQSCTAVTT